MGFRAMKRAAYAALFLRIISLSKTSTLHNQQGKVVVKFFWWPLIISILFSVLLTLFLNILL
jgi:hypothetical protein